MATFTLKQAGNFFGKDGELAGKMRKGALKGLYSAALRMKQQLVTREVPKNVPAPVDKGIYRAGWQVERLPDGAAVYNAVPYAVMIEEGVKGGSVVPSNKFQVALAEWVQRKLGGRKKAVSFDKQNAIADKTKKAKESHSERMRKWKVRLGKLQAKNAKRKAKGLAPLPPPKAPQLKIPGARARLGADFSAAWEVAGAIMHAMKKKGIFNRGRGLRIMEKYVKNYGANLVKTEVEREIAKELAKG